MRHALNPLTCERVVESILRSKCRLDPTISLPSVSRISLLAAESDVSGTGISSGTLLENTQQIRLASSSAAAKATSDQNAEAFKESSADQGRKRFFEPKIRYPQPNNNPQLPWTPTHQTKKWRFLPTRMGGLLQELEKEQESRLKADKKYPDFGPGSVLELHLAVPDNKGKSATFKGLLIAIRNKGCRTTLTLRNHLGTSGAIEQTFPLYSPTIKSIKVLDQRKVRRAKLYYLRERNPKEYRV